MGRINILEIVEDDPHPIEIESTSEAHFIYIRPGYTSLISMLVEGLDIDGDMIRSGKQKDGKREIIIDFTK